MIKCESVVIDEKEMKIRKILLKLVWKTCIRVIVKYTKEITLVDLEFRVADDLWREIYVNRNY